MIDGGLVSSLARPAWRYGLARSTSAELRERVRRVLTDPEVKGTLSP
jgi:hypothetical protein